MRSLFSQAGLNVVSIQSKFGGGRLGNLDRRLNDSLGKFLPGASFLTVQYIIKAARGNGTASL